MKSFFKSKTLWTGLLIFISSFSGIIDTVVKVYPSRTLQIIAAIFIALRTISNTQITFKGDKENGNSN